MDPSFSSHPYLKGRTRTCNFKFPGRQTPRSQLTALHSRDVSAVDFTSHGIQAKAVIPEKHIQTNLSLTVTHPHLTDTTNTNNKLTSLTNVFDNSTAQNDKGIGLSLLKKMSSILPHIKQDEITDHKNAVTANLHTNELMEMQRILNTTFYKVTDEPAVNNHLDLRKEGEFYPDATYPIENSYEAKLYDYYYYYEDLNTMFDVEYLRGPKGDTGPPVSCFSFLSLYMS